jgi:hypothetical protein
MEVISNSVPFNDRKLWVVQTPPLAAAESMRHLIDPLRSVSEQPLHCELGGGLQPKLGAAGVITGIGKESYRKRIKMSVDNGVPRKQRRFNFGEVAFVKESAQAAQ